MARLREPPLGGKSAKAHSKRKGICPRAATGREGGVVRERAECVARVGVNASGVYTPHSPHKHCATGDSARGAGYAGTRLLQ